MASGNFRYYYSPCWDFFFGSTSPSLGLALSCNPTLDPIPAPALVAINELLKQFTKAYLKSNQRSSQLLTEHRRSFKAKVPDVYYDKLHLDYYHFYLY